MGEQGRKLIRAAEWAAGRELPESQRVDGGTADLVAIGEPLQFIVDVVTVQGIRTRLREFGSSVIGLSGERQGYNDGPVIEANTNPERTEN